MDNSPCDFVVNHSARDLKRFEPFVHRTFNGIDCVYFIRSLRNIYLKHGGLESVFKFAPSASEDVGVCENMQFMISNFKIFFLEPKHWVSC